METFLLLNGNEVEASVDEQEALMLDRTGKSLAGRLDYFSFSSQGRPLLRA
jgi:prophage maintenance system killer protein